MSYLHFELGLSISSLSKQHSICDKFTVLCSQCIGMLLCTGNMQKKSIIKLKAMFSLVIFVSIRSIDCFTQEIHRMIQWFYKIFYICNYSEFWIWCENIKPGSLSVAGVWTDVWTVGHKRNFLISGKYCFHFYNLLYVKSHFILPCRLFWELVWSFL